MNYLKIFLLVCLTILVSKVDSKRINGEIYSDTLFTKYVGRFRLIDFGDSDRVDIDWNDNNIDTARSIFFSGLIENFIEKVVSLSCNNTSNIRNFYRVKGQGDSYWYLVIQNCEGNSNDKYLFSEPVALDFIFLFESLNLIVIVIWLFEFNRMDDFNGEVIAFLFIIMLTSVFSIAIQLLNYESMKTNFPAFKQVLEIGNWVYILSKNLFFLLLIYAAQGWTTTIYSESRIRNYINILLIVFNILLEWSLSYFKDYSKSDIRLYTYYLDYLPGYLTYVIYGLLMVYFIYCNINTYRSLNDNGKYAEYCMLYSRRFLKISTLVASVYMISPIFVGIIAHSVPEYLKFKVSTIINHTLDFIFHIMVMTLFQPGCGYHFLELMLLNPRHRFSFLMLF
ncbi:hypothetical protein ACTFIW_002779 [Dictyostelium discoideum]